MVTKGNHNKIDPTRQESCANRKGREKRGAQKGTKGVEKREKAKSDRKGGTERKQKPKEKKK